MPKSKLRPNRGQGIPLHMIGTRGMYSVKIRHHQIQKYSISPTGVILNRNGAPTIFKR